ncbi:hypothetical protein BRE01_31090 [Brevibacillus reuszeri]|nr:hypothetical protein [Brevibacillus reuszeri]MED1858432.1 hypothetical protein [Brevibacillus reuszeri]GED69407.1 hypothetical protein BRE01_31090 [Brevibacillus reuszeri]
MKTDWNKGRRQQQQQYSFGEIKRFMGDTGGRRFLKDKADNRRKTKEDAQ